MTIAVVGGGISGLYCAWRLAQSDTYRGTPIRLYHDAKSERAGGRLLSITCDESGSIFNLGAGRISRELHPRASRLVTELGLSLTPFGFSTDYWVLGKHRSCREDLIRHRVLTPSVHPRLHESAPLEWFDVASNVAEPCDEAATSFVDWMAQFVGAAHLPMVQDLQGYGILTNPDLPLSEARRILQQHPETKRGSDWVELADGFQSLAHTLNDHLATLGVEIVPGYRLTGVTQDHEVRRQELVFQTPSGHRTVVADRVILAMPSDALIELADTLEPSISDALRSVSPVPLFKMFATFAEPWWRSVGLPDGVCVRTDLPLQKVYFRPDNSVLIYCDSGPAEYWHRVLAENMTTPGLLHQTIVKLLAALTGAPESAICIKRTFERFWPAGVHFWRIGADPERIHDLLIGERTDGLHICGEAYSPNSGWIEGSLESVDRLLTRLEA